MDMLGAVQFNVFYSLLYKGTSLIKKRPPPQDQQRARSSFGYKFGYGYEGGVRRPLGCCLP